VNAFASIIKRRAAPDVFSSNPHALTMHVLACTFFGGDACTLPYVFHALPRLPALRGVELTPTVVAELLRSGYDDPEVLEQFVDAPLRPPDLAYVFANPKIPNLSAISPEGLSERERSAFTANPALPGGGFGADTEIEGVLGRLLYAPDDEVALVRAEELFKRDPRCDPTRMAVLAMRSALPMSDGIVKLLHNFLTDPDVYRQLSLTKAHMDWMERQIEPGDKIKAFYSDNDEVVCYVSSPTVAAGEVGDFVEMLQDDALIASALAYPNTPTALYRWAFDKNNRALGTEVFSHSPFSSDILGAGLCGILPADAISDELVASCRYATQEQMLRYFHAGKIEKLGLRLKFLDNKKFPFDHVLPKEVQDTFGGSPRYVGAAFSIGAAVSPAFAGRLSSDDSWAASFGAMFSETTSSIRLGRAVSKFSDLAALAACHPNGTKIPLSELPARHRGTVAAVRANQHIAASSVTPVESTLVL